MHKQLWKKFLSDLTKELRFFIPLLATLVGLIFSMFLDKIVPPQWVYWRILLPLSLLLALGRMVYKKYSITPIEIEIPNNELEENEFMFYVKNTSGVELDILPRNFRKDGNSSYIKCLPVKELRNYLLKDRKELILESKLGNGALYCSRPTLRYPSAQRKGLWATHLNPEGGDKKKMISTKHFRVYREYTDEIITKCKMELGNELPSVKWKRYFEERISWIKSTYEEQTGKKPRNLVDCVFPQIDVTDVKEIEIELKNIGKYRFAREENGLWKQANSES